MSFREWTSNNPVPVIAVVIVVLVAALGVVYLQLRTPSRAVPEQAWFFDVGDGQLFAADLQQIPPIDAPSGATTSDGFPGGVRAHVFTCGGNCDRDDDRFIGYLESFTPEIKQRRIALSEQHGGTPESLPPAVLRMGGLDDSDGRLVASADQPDQWVPADSDEGQRIMSTGMRQCKQGVRPTRCWAKTR